MTLQRATPYSASTRGRLAKTREVVPGFGSTIRVDDAASELPAGVVLSDDRTMITMPYGAAELVMALDCDSELELQEVADRQPHG